jgi:hypothetical protein
MAHQQQQKPTKPSSEVATDNLHKHHCQHCGTAFRSKRKDAKFCSSNCRKEAHRQKQEAKDKRKQQRYETKLLKLSRSSFGIYLVNQIRRAGTVEILRGQSKEGLKALAGLKTKATSASSFKDGVPGNDYHLSHIYPVQGKHLGLLTVENLVIAPAAFNLSHRALPLQPIEGTHYTTRASLKAKWGVSNEDTTLQILSKVSKYLPCFRAWLKSHPLALTQRESLIKALKEEGTTGSISRMSLAELQQLAKAKELPVYSFTRGARAPAEVLLEEVERLAPKSSLRLALQRIDDLETTFADLPPEWEEHQSEWTSFVVNQALLMLHQQPYSTALDGLPVLVLIPSIPLPKYEKEIQNEDTKEEQTQEDYL